MLAAASLSNEQTILALKWAEEKLHWPEPDWRCQYAEYYAMPSFITDPDLNGMAVPAQVIQSGTLQVIVMFRLYYSRDMGAVRIKFDLLKIPFPSWGPRTCFYQARIKIHSRKESLGIAECLKQPQRSTESREGRGRRTAGDERLIGSSAISYHWLARIFMPPLMPAP